ncbi:MAG: Bug family tripartite tricarboxylate transporter substrate binding protein [Burkholderiaceae bacterium]
MNRRLILQLLAVTGVSALSIPALTQTQARPIRIILGFSAGGGSDIVLRVIAQSLSLQLGQPVIVDNKPGADGIIAADFAAKSAPDGLTLYFGSGNSMVATPILRKTNVPYDPFKDFTPVASLGRFTMVMVSAPALPVKTVAEFVEYVRARPGKLNYASSHSTARLAAMQFLSQYKLEMEHVPYKGDAPAMTDLMGDRVHMMFGTAAGVRGFVQEGKFRALMSLRDSRSPVMPGVATNKEAGSHISVSPWAGLYGPANLSPVAVDRINQGLRSAVAGAEIRDRLEQLGFEPAISTPAELATLHRTEYEVFRKAVQDDGIKFD